MGDEIKVGDVVMLKSAGPAMVVATITEGIAHCNWFDDKTQKFGSFPVATLTKEI